MPVFNAHIPAAAVGVCSSETIANAIFSPPVRLAAARAAAL
jgi:hypothetical protein